MSLSGVTQLFRLVNHSPLAAARSLLAADRSTPRLTAIEASALAPPPRHGARSGQDPDLFHPTMRERSTPQKPLFFAFAVGAVGGNLA